MELELFLVPSRAERATANLNDHLGDRAAIQVGALGLRDRDVFGEILEQLDRLVVLMQRGVTEDTHAIKWQRRRGADLAAQPAPALARVKRAQSVYRVMVESSRRFSD